MSQRDRLRSLLQERSLRFGDFTLVSGRKSSYYFDSKQTTLDPEGAYLTAWCILDLVRRKGIDAAAIGGMTLGADPMVCAVAPLSFLEDGPELPAFIVRKEAKEHGTQNEVEGAPPAGTRVIIVDDVITTAGSTLKAIAAAERAGLVVAAVICLLDREEGGAEALSGYPYFPLFCRNEILPAAG